MIDKYFFISIEKLKNAAKLRNIFRGSYILIILYNRFVLFYKLATY